MVPRCASSAHSRRSEDSAVFQAARCGLHMRSCNTVQWRATAMKMGNMVSPWRYDVAAHVTASYPKLRRPAMPCCA